MNPLTIDDVSASGSELSGTVTVPPSLRRFFTENTFRVSYDVDVASVDESILAIPIVGHVAPVAWTNGTPIEVPTLDRTYLDSLDRVARSLQSMYPEFMDGGEVLVDRPVENDIPDGDGNGLLFSGGVDSVSSFARHREEVTTFVGVQGWTIGIDEYEEWAAMEAGIESIAHRNAIDTAFISTNALSMLDTPMLHAHFKRYLVGSWYSGVGHGLGLLSLCAPLSVASGIDHLYIASTHTESFEYPWGSHPEIDDHVRWGTVTATHDSYDLSRQEKVNLIAEFISESEPKLTLYTCNTDVATNCSSCEKCYRTAIGLYLAGVDPTEHGYHIRPPDLYVARERIESGDWLVDEDVLFMWRDLQRHAPDGTDHESHRVNDFFDWLSTADLDACFQRGTVIRENPRGRILRTLTRNTPYPVYAALYPVFDKIRNAMQSGFFV